MRIELKNLEKTHLKNLEKSLKDNPHYNFCFYDKETSSLKHWFECLDLDQKWLVVKMNNRVIGFVSFEGCSEYKEIQIFLKNEYKNKGFGTVILILAEKWARNKFKKLQSINANIAHDNIASILLFRKCGYHQEWGGDYIKWFY